MRSKILSVDEIAFKWVSYFVYYQSFILFDFLMT